MNPTRLRISATTLDSFRLFKQTEWYSWEKFYQELMGFRSETPEMRVGSAFHRIMENPEKYRFQTEFGNEEEDVFVCENITFSGIDKALQYREERAVTEVKLVAPFKIGQYEIDLVCKADAVYGRTIWDYKTRYRPFDADKADDLLMSLQWKAYCHAFGARRMIYVVAQLEETYSGAYNVVDVVTMELYAYPEIESQLRNELAEFIGLLEERYLLPYFQPKTNAQKTDTTNRIMPFSDSEVRALTNKSRYQIENEDNFWK